MSGNIHRFSEGENVSYISTGKIGTVNKVIKGYRGYSYKVTIDGKVRTVAERFLEPVVDTEERLIDDFINENFGGYSDYKLFQTWFRLSRPLESNLYSYLGSKTIFNQHQFKPLLRFLSPGSDERLFIADEVGVGKTIETGIILTELIARGRLDHHTPILIICPNSLGPKWVKEMKDRFRLHFHLHDGRSLRYTLETTLQDGVFPQKYIFSVVGLQLLRREGYLTLLKELDAKRELPTFGMVVIDEAHHMRNPETDSNELGNLLSSITEMMLMLSATPLNLKNEDLYNQMHILNPIAFPDTTTFETLQTPVIKLNRIRNLIAKNTFEAREEILSQLEELGKEPLGKVISSHPGVRDSIERLKDKTPFAPEEAVKYERLFVSLSPLYYSFTRTRKREALEHQVHREVWEVPVSLSDNEMKFHNDVLEAIKNYHLNKGGDLQAIGFIINTHRRMVSSCIPAIRNYLGWCIKENRILIMDETKISDEMEDDSQLGIIEIDPTLKREFVRLLKEAKELENVDSKYNQFKQILEKIFLDPETPQVIAFSFFVRTLEYLKRRLEADGFSVGIIHGGVPLQGNKEQIGRYEIMDAFKRGEYKILLSSEVGGEGLDFQYCHAIINYDLPYNPMRVEQRIGRVDRFGQKSNKIIVSNLFIKGTVDEEIYDRLYRRIRLVKDGIGDLEPILGKELSDVQAAIITGKLTEEQKEELSLRLETAIASAKIEMEEFEKHRKELLSDDYLAKPFNNIVKGNFVSPEDAVQLTEQCLSTWDGCSFVRINDERGELTLSENIISRLEQFLRHPKNVGGYNELQTLVSPENRIKVVFDGSIADSYPDHVFLSPTGYWARFLTHQLEQGEKILKTFSFRVKSSEIDIYGGEYIVFLFEVRLEGMRTEIEFLGVPVNVTSNSVVETYSEHLLRSLADAEGFDIHSIPEDLDPNHFLDIARDHFDRTLEEKRSEAAEENRYRIESRITALERSSELKIKKLKQGMESHTKNRKEDGKEPDERYLRLTKARIEKEKARLESKLNELQKCQELSLDYTLEGIVYLKVYGG
jgi:superfamily II DNA or RNA helicase